MKRSAFYFFILFYVVIAVPRTGTKATSGALIVWANDGGDKVAQHELRATRDPLSVLNSVWDGTTISLFGARNEVIAFNLVLEAPAQPLEDISISFNSLAGPDGFTIQSIPATGDEIFNWTTRDIELFFVKYLEIRGLSTVAYDTYDERHIPQRFQRPWSGEGQGIGYWEDRPDHNLFYPDIAVPLELVPQFSIPANSNQSIWVDIYIPVEAVPGLYRGILTITSKNNSYQVPVELTVHSFALPDIPAASTMLYVGYNDVNLRYLGMEEPDSASAALSKLILDRHFMLAHRHRISLIGAGEFADDVGPVGPAPEWLPRLDGTLFVPEQGYRGPGTGIGNGVYSIGTYGNWDWWNDDRATMWRLADAWVEWFETNAPETEFFLYLIDESTDYAQIQRWAGWIADNPGPGRQLMSMATLYRFDSVEFIPGLSIPTIFAGTGITEQWEALARKYQLDPDRRLYFYNGFRPASGTFVIEDDGIALRELAWGQYKLGIDRWFYWESTYYNDIHCGTGQTNIFQSARTIGSAGNFDSVLGETGCSYGNGEGVLFYPGTDTLYPEESYDVYGPFASLRLKHWRRGIQDADYLTLAAAIDPERVQAIIESIVPQVLWEYGVQDLKEPTWKRTDISWPINPDVWEAARRELAALIESGQSSLHILRLEPPPPETE